MRLAPSGVAQRETVLNSPKRQATRMEDVDAQPAGELKRRVRPAGEARDGDEQDELSSHSHVTRKRREGPLGLVAELEAPHAEDGLELAPEIENLEVGAARVVEIGAHPSETLLREVAAVHEGAALVQTRSKVAAAAADSEDVVPGAHEEQTEHGVVLPLHEPGSGSRAQRWVRRVAGVERAQALLVRREHELVRTGHHAVWEHRFNSWNAVGSENLRLESSPWPYASMNQRSGFR
jgi:hypothetical protein